jgi:hypothetical protein
VGRLAEQDSTQTLAEQICPDGQTLPQLPQLLGSSVRLEQNVGLPAGQAVVPLAQLSTQAPPAQSWPAAQAVPQAPQLATSVAVLEQIGAVPEAVPGQVALVVQ